VIELLKLCGFETDEINTQLPRIQRVFTKLGINSDDIELGKQRLNKFYDIKLSGVRGMFRLYILRLADMVLARDEGKKFIVYGLMSPGADVTAAALIAKSKEVFSGHPGLLSVVLGCIFDKLNPVLEAAEKVWLKAGKVSHCANQKLYIGALALDFIPKPDLLVTCGLLCDSSSKAMDVMEELWGIPTFYYDTCKDMETMDDPRARDVMSLAAKSLRGLVIKLQDMTGIEITDDMIWEVLNAGRDFGSISLELSNLIAESDPMPIGSAHHNIFYRLNRTATDINNYPSAVEVLTTLYEEVQERVKEGYGVVEKGAPRIFCLMPPSESSPDLEHLIDELGIANIASENRLYPPDGRRSPSGERSKNPYEAMCGNLLTSMYQTPKARIPALTGFCRSLKVDGVLARYHAGCRSAALDAMIIRSEIKRELNIPVVVLDWENFDPRVFNYEQYRRILETFKLTMRPSTV
jgi:benzoyl-CoA reductase/2-hydroxyglutaryl-CoA dehydratase subunit BcrC/BadD/HgdB